MNHAERAHAPLSASKAHIWEVCPGSKFFPEVESVAGPAAIEGTEAHEACEIEASWFLKEKVHGPSGPIPVIDERYAEVAEDYTQILWKEVLNETITGIAYEFEDKLVLDERLGMWGFSDFWAVYIDERAKRTGVILDFKYGRFDVSVNNNPQLAFYAVALQEEISRLGKALDHVRVCIYQPRTSSGEAFKDTWFTRKQLESWKKKFYKAAEQIYVKKVPKFKVGEHCRFCEQQFRCEKYQKNLNTRASLAIIDPEKAELPAVESLPDETIAKIVLNKELIEEFLKRCKGYVIQKALAGQSIKGVKCVEGRTKRKWIEDADRISALLEREGVQPFRSVLRNLTDVEKEIKTTKGAKAANFVMQELCDHTKPSIKVVPESDERPAIVKGLDVLIED